MRRDRENTETQRVTRRSGTRVDGEFDASRSDARARSHRDGYSYLDDRRHRDEREDRDDRRYRDERDDRDDRRYRDERDDRDDRRYRDERDDRDDRRYRDEREGRDDRRYPKERNESSEPREVQARDPKTPRSVTKSSRGNGGRRGGNPDRTVHQLVPYALFCLSVFAGVSFFLRDFAGLEGQTGEFGSFLADFLCGILGVIAYALPVFMFVWALRWRSYVKKGQLLKKLLLGGAFLALLSGIVHVFQDATRGTLSTLAADLYHNGVARVGGGFFGGFVGEWLGYVLRLPGTIILAIPLLVIIAIYLIGMTPSGLWQRISCKVQMMQEKHAERRAAMYDGTKEPSHKEKAQSKPVKEQGPIAVTKWSEPRPLEQSAPRIDTFSFSEEEDEPVVLQTPFARPQPRVQDPTPQPAAAPVVPEQSQAPAQPATPETVLQETMREQVTFGDATSVQPQAAAQPQSTEQPQKSGQVFAPFALPVQPFPERTSHTAYRTPEAASEAQPETQPVTPAPAAHTEQTDEILGAFAPASRPAASQQPRPVSAASAPSAEYTSPFFAEPVSPVRQAAQQEEVPEKKEPVQPFSYFASVQEEDAEAQSAVAPSSPFASATSVEMPKEIAPVAQDELTVEQSFSYESEDDEDEIISEEETEADEFYVPAAPAASAVSFDREYVASAMNIPTWGEEKKDEQEEPAPAPISVQAERVAPQPVPTLVDTPAVAYTPAQPAPPRVEVRSTPVSSESVPCEPVILEYKHPPIDLLNEDKNVRTDDFYEEIEETKDILRQTMASFNIRIQDEINYSHGPSVTRYEMRPVAGTSVRSVTNRTEDIALNLASSVRIEAPIPGKPAIGIEVPNKVRETVYMRTMLESEEFRSSKDPLDVPLGLDVGGDVRMCNLAKMPHLLVAGTTGPGKSVCINTILVSLLYKTSPDDLRLILIDPKQIEFAPYEDVPHLYMPIVTDMQRAAGALACAVQEMERRFSLIKDVGVRNIEAYNEAVKNDPDREHLPYIIIVIDEFNDLKMSCNNNDPENFTVRIAQKARAAGIHLIIGTQRPSVDVITGKLKGNIPSRIAFMVKQQVDSRTILDVNGAEALTGRGDMLYVATTSSDKNPVRIQGAFVSDGELERVVSFVRRNNAPVQYNRAFMDQIEVEMARAAKADRKGDDFDYGDEEEGGEDPKFVEAVELSIQAQKVATSLLQRRLGVGYGRAAKIIDRMEELGLVSPAEGNKPRKILPAAQGYLEHIGAMSADGEDDFGDDYG